MNLAACFLFFSHPPPEKTRRETQENIWGLIKRGQDGSDWMGAGNTQAAAATVQEC